MKALLALPGVDRRLDIAAIAQFMSLRYVPAPRTHVQGIRKLRRASRSVWDRALNWPTSGSGTRSFSQ